MNPNEALIDLRTAFAGALDNHRLSGLLISMAQRLPWIFWSVLDDERRTIVLSRGTGLARFGVSPGQLEGESRRELFPDSVTLEQAMSLCRQGASFHLAATVMKGYPTDLFLTWHMPWTRYEEFVGLRCVTMVVPQKALSLPHVTIEDNEGSPLADSARPIFGGAPSGLVFNGSDDGAE